MEGLFVRVCAEGSAHRDARSRFGKGGSEPARCPERGSARLALFGPIGPGPARPRRSYVPGNDVAQSPCPAADPPIRRTLPHPRLSDTSPPSRSVKWVPAPNVRSDPVTLHFAQRRPRRRESGAGPLRRPHIRPPLGAGDCPPARGESPAQHAEWPTTFSSVLCDGLPQHSGLHGSSPRLAHDLTPHGAWLADAYRHLCAEVAAPTCARRGPTPFPVVR
jgi:hypothetical protein